MRGRKTPAVAFITRLIYTTSHTDFIALLERSPLTTDEKDLVLRYANGALYKELADHFHVSAQAIYTRKRNAYIKLHAWIAQNITKT